MKHYTFPNLSESAQEFTAAFFQLIASLAETFVYVVDLIFHYSYKNSVS